MPQRFTSCLLFLAVVIPQVHPLLAAQDNVEAYSDLVLKDQPVAYWSFSEASPAKSIPSKGRVALQAKVFGKVALGQQGPRTPGFPLFSRDNTAVEFPGGKDCFQVDDPGEKSPLDFDSGDSITLEAWVFPSAIGNDQYVSVISKGRTGNAGFAKDNLNYALRLKGNGQVALLNFLFRSRDETHVTEKEVKQSVAPMFHRWTSSSGFPIEGGWHHVAVTYSFGAAGSLRAYLDGRAIDGSWDMEGDTAAPPFVDNDQLWNSIGVPRMDNFRVTSF